MDQRKIEIILDEIEKFRQNKEAVIGFQKAGIFCKSQLKVQLLYAARKIQATIGYNLTVSRIKIMSM